MKEIHRQWILKGLMSKPSVMKIYGEVPLVVNVTRDKKFEIRKNDRDYHVGDKLVLHEFDNGKYTGNSITRWIIYIHHGNGEYGIEKGYCVLGLTDNPNDKYTPT